MQISKTAATVLAIGSVVALISACNTGPAIEEKKALSQQGFGDDVGTGGFKSEFCDQLNAHADNELMICVRTGPNPGCVLSPEGQLAYILRNQYCNTEDEVMCGDTTLKKACEGVSGKLLTCCGGTCANTYADPVNCGKCGEVCAVDNVCVAGKCLCQSDFTADPENCKGTPPAPAQVTCADIASVNAWPSYAQNGGCWDALETQYDDAGNICCPVFPVDDCPGCA
jgi:hypothetical protein